MNPPVIVLATGNQGKLRELQDYLQGIDCQLQLKPEGLEVEETGTTFRENAEIKAAQVAQVTGHWAIADDSGLAVDALGGRPGVYSARYGATDPDRIAKLLKELGNQPVRSAQFICAVALARPDGAIALVTEGTCSGSITSSPMGDNGFGYDPIFYVPTQGQTFAQMTPAVKRSLSHRGQAFKQLIPQLVQMIQAEQLGPAPN